jgi:hypothetical protein
VQRQGFDQIEVKAHQPVELRTMGQGRESSVQVVFGVAVEVSLAGEAGPLSEEGPRVTTSLGFKDASGPGRESSSGRWEWRKSSTMT